MTRSWRLTVEGGVTDDRSAARCAGRACGGAGHVARQGECGVGEAGAATGSGNRGIGRRDARPDRLKSSRHAKSLQNSCLAAPLPASGGSGCIRNPRTAQRSIRTPRSHPPSRRLTSLYRDGVSRIEKSCACCMAATTGVTARYPAGFCPVFTVCIRGVSGEGPVWTRC